MSYLKKLFKHHEPYSLCLVFYLSVYDVYFHIYAKIFKLSKSEIILPLLKLSVTTEGWAKTQGVSKCARIGLACWPSPWNPRIPTFMPATWNGVSENLDDCCWFRCFPSNVLKPIVWFCHKCLTEHKKESFLPIRAPSSQAPQPD